VAEIDPRLAAAGRSGQLGGASEAEEREPGARGVDEAGAFELEQRLSGGRRAHAGGVRELRRIDVARVARQAEQRKQDTICSGLVHGSIIP
jgi:hypothetical protein